MLHCESLLQKSTIIAQRSKYTITEFGLLIVVDTAHSERYMGMATPSDNLDGYEVNTVLRIFIFVFL